MKQIAEITGHINPGAPMRNIGLRNGDTLGERAMAEDKIAFDAQALVRNGWTADRERAFQYNARQCGMFPLLSDADKLIAAIEKAQADITTAGAREKQKRAEASALETSQMPPMPDFSDIPPPADDDIPFDIR